MTVRFRKSIRIAGPIRLNLSRSGPSLSFRLGPLSWNTRRRRLRANLPGPLYWEQEAPQHRRRRVGQGGAALGVWVVLTAVGVLVLAVLLF